MLARVLALAAALCAVFPSGFLRAEAVLYYQDDAGVVVSRLNEASGFPAVAQGGQTDMLSVRFVLMNGDEWMVRGVPSKSALYDLQVGQNPLVAQLSKQTLGADSLSRVSVAGYDPNAHTLVMAIEQDKQRLQALIFSVEEKEPGVMQVIAGQPEEKVELSSVFSGALKFVVVGQEGAAAPEPEVKESPQRGQKYYSRYLKKDLLLTNFPASVSIPGSFTLHGDQVMGVVVDVEKSKNFVLEWNGGTMKFTPGNKMTILESGPKPGADQNGDESLKNEDMRTRVLKALPFKRPAIGDVVHLSVRHANPEKSGQEGWEMDAEGNYIVRQMVIFAQKGK